jgi:hypothetical protein
LRRLRTLRIDFQALIYTDSLFIFMILIKNKYIKVSNFELHVSRFSSHLVV